MLQKNSINHECSGIFVFLTKQFDKISYHKVIFTIFFVLSKILYPVRSQNNDKKYENAVISVVNRTFSEIAAENFSRVEG